MFVNDEDFAFVGSVFFNFGKPYICKGKAVHAQKAKSLLRQNITKMQWTLFRGGDGFFGKTSCRVLFKRTSDIFVIFVTAQFCVKAFVLTTHAKQHNKFVQNFKKIRSVFTKLDFCSIICIRRSLETLPIPNKIYCTFVIGGVR